MVPAIKAMVPTKAILNKNPASSRPTDDVSVGVNDTCHLTVIDISHVQNRAPATGNFFK